MSLLNGLAGLASGLGDFKANLDRDEAATAEAPQKPLEAPIPSAAPPDQAAATPAPAASAVAGQGIPAGVPPALLPIYQAASRRTGIPLAVLIAQGQQESGFRSDAVGKAGEIGISQIKPSTAANPGYGMKGIDPATLKDPAVNINFAADYLRARAGLGVDFSDPKAVDAALARYNGGGDPNYVANVRGHMRGT